jgi:hypothetical protein
MAVMAYGTSCCNRSGREVQSTRRESGELRQATRILSRKYANRLGDVTFTAQLRREQLTGLVTCCTLNSLLALRLIECSNHSLHFIVHFIAYFTQHSQETFHQAHSVGVPCFELNNGALSTYLTIAVSQKGSLSSEDSNCDLVIVRARQLREIIAIFVSLCFRY